MAHSLMLVTVTTRSVLVLGCSDSCNARLSNLIITDLTLLALYTCTPPTTTGLSSSQVDRTSVVIPS